MESWEWFARPNRIKFKAARDRVFFAAAADVASRANKFCGGDPILLRYLTEHALPDADFVLTVHVADNLIGFATLLKHGNGWNPGKKKRKLGKWIELDLICAWDVPGLGTKIVREVERFAKQKGADGVDLHSVPKAINFYRSLGYANSSVGRPCREHSAISTAAVSVAKLRFPSDQAASQDAKFARFLKTLVKHRATHKSCHGIGLERHQCSFYGYPMTKCFT
jgi:Acetyltransferase (GNAT) family